MRLSYMVGGKERRGLIGHGERDGGRLGAR